MSVGDEVRVIATGELATVERAFEAHRTLWVVLVRGFGRERPEGRLVLRSQIEPVRKRGAA